MGARLTAFEALTPPCIDILGEQLPHLRWPMEERATDAVLIELSDPDSEAGRAALEGLLEHAMEAGWVSDAAIAASIAQSREFWSLREHMTEAQQRCRQNIKHDIAVPVSRIADFVEQTNAAIAKAFPRRPHDRVRPSRRRQFALQRVAAEGHAGDDFRHMSSKARGSTASPMTPLRLQRLGVGEHGLGVLRRGEAARYKSAVELETDARDQAGARSAGHHESGQRRWEISQSLCAGRRAIGGWMGVKLAQAGMR